MFRRCIARRKPFRTKRNIRLIFIKLLNIFINLEFDNFSNMIADTSFNSIKSNQIIPTSIKRNKTKNFTNSFRININKFLHSFSKDIPFTLTTIASNIPKIKKNTNTKKLIFGICLSNKRLQTLRI